MQTFNQIASQIFKIDESDVRDSMSSKDVPDWDSMNYLLFIAELEKEFKISFTMQEAMNAQNIGDLRKAVQARGTLS